MMRKQTITQGTLTLLAAGFLTQVILPIINQIAVIRALGEEGIGLYVLILPTLSLLTTLAGMAIPSLSRYFLLSKKKAGPAILFSLPVSAVLTLLLLWGAPALAGTLLKDSRAALPLLFLGPLVACTSIFALLRTYFQSLGNMTPPAAANLAGQGFRIYFSIRFIGIFRPFGPAAIVSGVMGAFIIGELISIAILGACYHFQTPGQLPPRPQPLEGRRRIGSVLRRLAAGSFTQLIQSFTEFLEPILIMHLLFRIGYPGELSRKLFGAVSGFTFPILLLPAFISRSLMQNLATAIGEAYRKKNFPYLSRCLDFVSKWFFLTYGFFAIVVMVYATEIMSLFFNTSTGAQYLPLLAPFFFLSFYQSALGPFLQAVDESPSLVKTTFIASLVKLSLLIYLTPQPRFSIFGFIIATMAYHSLLTCWQFKILKEKIGYRPHPHKVFNGLLTLMAVYISARLLQQAAIWRGGVLAMGVQVFILGAVFGALALFCGLLPRRFKP